MKKNKLLLATTNPGKVREIKALFKTLPFQIMTIAEVSSLPKNLTIKEIGQSFSQNARIKAEIIGRKAKILTLADDSGLEIDALSGAPGTESKRFAPTDQTRINKVLELLQGVPQKKRTAHFKACIAIYQPKTDECIFFEGTTEGRILEEPRGNGGFGYDPIFFSTELGKSFAQATLSKKNEVSHRGRALNKAKKFLIKYFSTSSNS